MQLRKWVILGTLLGILGACSSALQTDLNVQRELWKTKRPASYTFELVRSCFCSPETTGPVTMVVSEEQIETLVYSDSGLTVKPENRRYFPTINGLFDVVEAALKDGADDLEVRWHEDLGYPKTINIDYIQNAIDDEVSFSVLRFEAGP